MAKRAWDDSVLTDGSQVTAVDDRTNEDRENTRERLAQGGHLMTLGTIDGTTENTDGRHTVGVATEQGSAGEWNIYDDDGTTKVVRVVGSTYTVAADRNKVILKAGWVWSGPDRSSGNRSGMRFTRVLWTA